MIGGAERGVFVFQGAGRRTENVLTLKPKLTSETLLAIPY